MYACSAAANQPDWYTRRISDIRKYDLRYVDHWAYDRWGKPTSYNAYGFVDGKKASKERFDVPLNLPDLGTRKPRRIIGREVDVRYGLFHPDHYEMPNHHEIFPPRIDQKHM